MTEKEFLKRLGDRISKKREALSITKTELGVRVELSRMHIFRIEKGEQPTSIIALRRIAEELEIDLSDLVKIK